MFLQAHLPSPNSPVHSTTEQIVPDENPGNFSDSSDSTNDECIENSFSCKAQEIQPLEQWDFNDEEGINTDSMQITRLNQDN